MTKINIASGLSGCQVVVACVSDEYSKSYNCKMEIRHAVQNLKLPVIVCIVGSNSMKWCFSEVVMLVGGFPQISMVNDNPATEMKEYVKSLHQHYYIVDNSPGCWIKCRNCYNYSNQ